MKVTIMELIRIIDNNGRNLVSTRELHQVKKGVGGVDNVGSKKHLFLLHNRGP